MIYLSERGRGHFRIGIYLLSEEWRDYFDFLVVCVRKWTLVAVELGLDVQSANGTLQRLRSDRMKKSDSYRNRKT